MTSVIRPILIRVAVGESGGGRARRLLRLWPLWESLARKLWPACPIPGSPYGWVSVHFTQHRGKPVELTGGDWINEGDALGELHFNNSVLIARLGQATGSEKWPAVTMFRGELTALAHWISDPACPHAIKAVYGKSILWRGGPRLGFTTRPFARKLSSRLESMFLAGLLIIYSSEGLDRTKLGRTIGSDAGEVWMSTQDLMTRYGNGKPRVVDAPKGH